MAVVVTLAGLWLTVGVARAVPPLGALKQLPGTAGCFTFDGSSEDGADTCGKARGLAEAESATVSPDGANVYVGSYLNTSASLETGFAVFSRNRSTGALTQLSGKAGCLTPDGASSAGPGTCTKARGLIVDAGDGHDLALTSDGRWAYMVAQNNAPHGAVLIFKRAPATGALTQLAGTAGCISFDGTSQDGAATCGIDATLNGASGISISPDDRFLYVTDFDTPPRMHTFSRNAMTGALTELQCISDAPAPTGCTTGRVVGNSQFVAFTPDGEHAYGADFQHGLSVFDRSPSSGLLTQKTGSAGCITDDGTDNTGASTCAVGRVVRGSYPPLVATNGATLYDPARVDDGFSVFHIKANGTLTQLAGAKGCVTFDGKDNTGSSTCASARAMNSPYGGALSADGGSLYVSQDNNSTGGVGVFALRPATGFATQLPGLPGCVTSDGSTGGTAGQCEDGRALSGGYGTTVSRDGRSVYEANLNSATGLAIYARTRAVLANLSVLPRRFSLAGRRVNGHCVKPTKKNSGHTKCRRPIALRVSYTLNGSVTVTFTLERAAPGRKVNGRCVRPTAKNKSHKRCRRFVAVHGKLTRLSTPGANHFPWDGRIGGHKLGRGSYRLTATPTGGMPGKVGFKIVR